MNRLVFLSCLFVISCCFLACSREDADFRKLRSARRDSPKGREIATELKDTQRGVELALADMNCAGGSNRGWSNWILEESSIDSVDLDLRTILNGADKRERKIAASWILWRRTSRPDDLEALFMLVREPGDDSVDFGRFFLALTTTNQALRAQIQVDKNVALSMSEEEFSVYLKKGVLGAM